MAQGFVVRGDFDNLPAVKVGQTLTLALTLITLTVTLTPTRTLSLRLQPKKPYAIRAFFLARIVPSESVSGGC